MKVCPNILEPEFMAAINEVATKWHDSANRPKIAGEVLHAWDALLIDWIRDDTMPIFVRSSKDIRGTEVTHKCSNRVLIPSDNSPAHWSFGLAASGKIPTLADGPSQDPDSRGGSQACHFPAKPGQKRNA
jgi:hypothetical protein